MKITKFELFFIVLLAQSCSSQPSTTTKEIALNKTINFTQSLKDYSFIKQSVNKIENDSLLKQVFQKLYNAKKKNNGKINMVQIGDSHIQADYISNAIRIPLQHYFGNAGRGLIFPYKYAKTNGPDNYRSSSNINWISNKVLTSPHVGVAGFRLFTNGFVAEMSLAVNNQYDLDYSFTKATVFAGQNETQKMSLYDNNSPEKAIEDSTFNSPIAKRFLFSKPISSVYQTYIDLEKQMKLYDGLFVENNQSGLIYSSMGVNGAKYNHYQKSENFYKELEVINPDIVIFSLGTNEGFSSKIGGFDVEIFHEEVIANLENIKQICPNAIVLLMTPPDSYKMEGTDHIKNPNIKLIRNKLIEIAVDKKLPYWDMFTVLGGYGSMEKWADANMTDKIWIHFSKKGYQIQGTLFAKAFIESFEKYCETKKIKLND